MGCQGLYLVHQASITQSYVKQLICQMMLFATIVISIVTLSKTRSLATANTEGIMLKCMALHYNFCNNVLAQTCAIEGVMILQPSCMNDDDLGGRSCSNSFIGQLLICIGGKYRKICHDKSQLQNFAEVACREVGHTSSGSGIL